MKFSDRRIASGAISVIVIGLLVIASIMAEPAQASTVGHGVARAATQHQRRVDCTKTNHNRNQCRATIWQVEGMYDAGTSMGPNANTYGGKMTTVDWVNYNNPQRAHPVLRVTNPAAPTIVGRHRLRGNDCAWYQIACWIWGPIMNAADPSEQFFTNVAQPCLSGSENGFVGSYGGSLASHIIFYTRGVLEDAISVSPEGFAYATIGGCFIGFLKMNLP
jgi:hypothetical protein